MKHLDIVVNNDGTILVALLPLRALRALLALLTLLALLALLSLLALLTLLTLLTLLALLALLTLRALLTYHITLNEAFLLFLIQFFFALFQNLISIFQILRNSNLW